MRKSNFNFEIEKTIAVISSDEKGENSTQLNLVKWGKNPGKLDIRHWYCGSPEKGVTINDSEARILFNALKVYLDEKQNESGDSNAR